jgi:histidinol-phosphate aminotransferase
MQQQRHLQMAALRSPHPDPDLDGLPPAAELLGRVRPAPHLDFNPYRTPRGDVLKDVPEEKVRRRLDLNEGPPAPVALLGAWLAELGRTALHTYPDEHALDPRNAIAAHVGLDVAPGDAADWVAVGAGSVQLYQHVPLAFRHDANPGRNRALVFSPCYGAYHSVIRGAGWTVVRHRSDRDGLDLDAMPRAARDSGAGLVVLCSPNNPTGEPLPNALVADVCAAADGIVMCDEAYGEFSSADSAVALLDRCPNLVVTGTTSKAFSLANLRAGWAVANPRLIEALGRVQTPWHVSGPAQLATTLALGTYRHEVAANVQAVTSQRARMAAGLQRVPGVERVLASEGNFLAFRTKYPAGEVWGALLVRYGIQIRDMATVMGDPNYLRVSVTASPADTDVFLQAIGEVLCVSPSE